MFWRFGGGGIGRCRLRPSVLLVIEMFGLNSKRGASLAFASYSSSVAGGKEACYLLGGATVCSNTLT